MRVVRRSLLKRPLLPTHPQRMKSLEYYFDTQKGTYWLRQPSGRFLNLDKSNLKLHLRRSGLTKEAYVDSLNELENALVVAQTDRAVDYAGPLAGHRVGMIQTTDGRKILITSQAADVFKKPTEKGEFNALQTFLEQLLGDQICWVLYWLKFARESLFKGDFRPGQLLVLAGPPGCGKSLFQQLVTVFLGGRCAAPYMFMSSKTTFNADLAQAEHLVIDDAVVCQDIKSRRAYASAVKEFTVVRDMHIHGKGQQAIMLPVYRRLTQTMNDEAETLLSLPPMDASILDKVVLVRCQRAEIGHDRDKVWADLVGDLPAFTYWLAHGLVVPKDVRCPRFGFKSFQDPELMQLLSSGSPEFKLGELIDEAFFSGEETTPRTFTAGELEKELRNSSMSFAVERLLYYSSACGVYLARLAVAYPTRYSYTKSKGQTKWTIKAP